MKKCILAIIAALVMCLLLLPATALAEETEAQIPEISVSADIDTVTDADIDAVADITIADEDIPSDWAIEEIDAATEAGLVPENLQKDFTKPVTRGDVAQMFINLIEKCSGQLIDGFLSSRDLKINISAFTDTADKAVLAANALGIINGMGGGKFEPEGVLTRAQIAAIINRVARVLGVDTEGYSHNFIDVAGHWVDAELGWPLYAGVVNGVGENKYNPDGQLTIEQAIAITYRALLADKPVSLGKKVIDEALALADDVASFLADNYSGTYEELRQKLEDYLDRSKQIEFLEQILSFPDEAAQLEGEDWALVKRLYQALLDGFKVIE
jgi:hypothetical protein